MPEHNAGWNRVSIGFRSIVTAIVMIPSLAGCGSTKMTSTPRTGTEQLLLTNAWDTALRKIDFSPLTGVPVYLDTQYVTAIDQGWVVSSLRQALLSQGVMLRAKPEQAQWVVEARVGAYGTDSYNFLVGIPQTTVPMTVTGMPAGTIPEIPFIKKSHQEGVAKLALFAYDRATGQLVWKSGSSTATANAKEMYVGGVGPIQSGTIRGGTEFVGVKIPAGSDPNATDENQLPTKNSPALDPMTIPVSPADRDAFVP
jgi:hypothetical protein